MATWGVHLRIATLFLNKIDKKHHREFVIGSVAPDCGYGEKDSFGDFVPPPQVTHWSPSGMKNDCRYKDFYNLYLTGERNDDYWFYLGYYVHLLADILWSVTMYLPTRVKYSKEYKQNPDFLRRIKMDWNDIDMEYLCSLKYTPALDIIRNAGEVKDYLPYYEPGQLTTQIKFIAAYYKDCSKLKKREYIYATPNDIANFIHCAYELINMILTKEGLV